MTQKLFGKVICCFFFFFLMLPNGNNDKKVSCEKLEKNPLKVQLQKNILENCRVVK